MLICLATQAMAQESLSSTVFEQRLSIPGVQLLDVRTAGEFQASHLKNALQADWNNRAQFTDRTQYLDKTRPILVYCASGVRSVAAAKWLVENGFTNVQHLKGGLTAWKLDGKPVVTATANTAQMKVETYRTMIGSSKVVLVDFGAAWCPPCRQMDPVLQQLQKEIGTKFTLRKIDADTATDVMRAHSVGGIPTFIIYKNGKETWRKEGVATISELKGQVM